MALAASFTLPSSSSSINHATPFASAYPASSQHTYWGHVRGPFNSVTPPSRSDNTSATSSPISATSSPATAAAWPTPPAPSTSHRTLPPPSLHRLPPIRPPADYFSVFSHSPPPAYHHPNLDKMSMSSVVASPSGELPKIAGSMTSKEWVVPPRPKPGRKPATDTPPTKRKAQNRAAQRAFRERRAARVGELEELLDQQKDATDKRENDFKDRIRELEMDVQSYKSRCQVLEGLLDRERQDRVKAETELEGVKRRWDRQAPFSAHHSQDNTPTQLPSISTQLHTPTETTPLGGGASEQDYGCGSCSPNGRCACADSILQTVEASSCGKCDSGANCQCIDDATAKITLPDLKRAPSPSLASVEKRQRSDAHAPELANEIDFTSFFKKPQAQQPSVPAGRPKDPCGFCKEGGYCVCADTSLPAVEPSFGAPPPYSQQTTPPPSENDVVPPMPMEINPDGAVKLRPRQPPVAPAMAATKSRSCGPNGPGTCAQCVADPISGLFCRALSASMNKGGSGGGCCGGAGRSGGCCKSDQAPKPAPKTGFGLSLSCAEAYQTLSSHRNFDKATDDISSWLPKLRAIPRPGEALPSPTASSRAPIEVEAASIMSVLKDFDIRFGRGL